MLNANKNNGTCVKNDMIKRFYQRPNKYIHDIGRWASVKICKYDMSLLNENVDNIPEHVIRSLNN